MFEMLLVLPGLGTPKIAFCLGLNPANTASVLPANIYMLMEKSCIIFDKNTSSNESDLFGKSFNFC